MLNDLAPIGISTYGRLLHVQQTIAALQKNPLARQSELYLFSDAPKAGDEEKVDAVRRYLRTVDGFKAVYLFEREKNDRVANNRDGMRMLLEKYGKMIFLEEDIITAPSFLLFMNEALNECKDDPKVFAVNAYTPPIDIPSDYQARVVLLPRFAAWGFGIWKEKFDEILMDITPEMYRELRSDKQKMKQYCLGGNDVVTQLWLQAHGYINALDVMIDYTMFVKGRQYVVCPTHSLAHSIGCDGSGEHWVRATKKYDVKLDVSDEARPVESGVQPDDRIMEQLRLFYKLGLRDKLALLAMDHGLYPMIRTLRRRLLVGH